nr:hypothetical protein [Tanacetum cinerariifolium]
MLQIFPNVPGQKFVDPPFEEEILAFIRKPGYSGNIKSLFDVKVDTLHQPWRTFKTIINKCLSGKVIGLDQLRLSQAQIIWGKYYQKNVDYVYLLWEDLAYRIKKVSKKNKDMYYPRFTKVIINFINEGVGRINTYYDFATEKVIPRPKYVWRSTREKTYQAPKSSLGANEGTGVSPRVLDVPLYGSTDEQISWKSSDEDDDDEVSMSKDDEDNADNEDDDDQDDDNEQTESDNDGDDFVHLNFSTHDE